MTIEKLMSKRLIDFPIASITIGERHRKDLGDLPSLAQSIQDLGLLHPIGITPQGTLIIGERRLRACQKLGWTEIPARVIEIARIAEGEFAENELRKDFTTSERVAILATIARHKHGGDRKSADLEQKIAVDAITAAKLAGFGNKETARQAAAVVKHGVGELVDAMDKGEISISAAAAIAKQPKSEQPAIAQATLSPSGPIPKMPKPTAPKKPAAEQRNKAISAFSQLLRTSSSGSLHRHLEELRRMLQDENKRIGEIQKMPRIALARGFLAALGVTLDDLKPLGGFP